MVYRMSLIALTHFNQGTPVAYFPNNQCNLGSYFGVNNIIINLTFCAYTELIDLGNVLTILYRR